MQIDESPSASTSSSFWLSATRVPSSTPYHRLDSRFGPRRHRPTSICSRQRVARQLRAALPAFHNLVPWSIALGASTSTTARLLAVTRSRRHLDDPHRHIARAISSPSPSPHSTPTSTSSSTSSHTTSALYPSRTLMLVLHAASHPLGIGFSVASFLSIDSCLRRRSSFVSYRWDSILARLPSGARLLLGRLYGGARWGRDDEEGGAGVDREWGSVEACTLIMVTTTPQRLRTWQGTYRRCPRSRSYDTAVGASQAKRQEARSSPALPWCHGRARYHWARVVVRVGCGVSLLMPRPTWRLASILSSTPTSTDLDLHHRRQLRLGLAHRARPRLPPRRLVHSSTHFSPPDLDIGAVYFLLGIQQLGLSSSSVRYDGSGRVEVGGGGTRGVEGRPVACDGARRL
ncbi:hypothetical protein C8R45DRAFT_1224768 [Mycena sanguinolenta]|nr:hypothetical protein C8R45DRAFT_1224768 [Mycena sanguinolenta]